MATWSISPTSGGASITNGGVATLPKNSGATDIEYTITYIDDNGCSGATTYKVPSGSTCQGGGSCNPKVTVDDCCVFDFKSDYGLTVHIEDPCPGKTLEFKCKRGSTQSGTYTIDMTTATTYNTEYINYGSEGTTDFVWNIKEEPSITGTTSFYVDTTDCVTSSYSYFIEGDSDLGCAGHNGGTVNILNVNNHSTIRIIFYGGLAGCGGNGGFVLYGRKNINGYDSVADLDDITWDFGNISVDTDNTYDRTQTSYNIVGDTCYFNYCGFTGHISPTNYNGRFAFYYDVQDDMTADFPCYNTNERNAEFNLMAYHGTKMVATATISFSWYANKPD